MTNRTYGESLTPPTMKVEKHDFHGNIKGSLILIVEDEEDLRTALTYSLQRAGFQTEATPTGEEALHLAGGCPTPDLILLDVMLPGISGTEISRRLRTHQNTKSIPILMLTAKAEESDRISGFESGADDYVTKPFSIRELILRIQAILRRHAHAYAHVGMEPSLNARHATFGTLRIDFDGHRIWVQNREIVLTAKEFKLLTLLLNRKGRVQTRDTLLNDVWGAHVFVQSRTVDAHIKQLRKKLDSAGHYIQTLRGIGYRFQETP